MKENMTTYDLHNIYNITKNTIGYGIINEAVESMFNGYSTKLLPCNGGIEITGTGDMNFDPNQIMIEVFKSLIHNNAASISAAISENIGATTPSQVIDFYTDSTINQLFITVGMLGHKFFIIKY